MAKFRFEDLEIWQEACAIGDELDEIAEELERRGKRRYSGEARGVDASRSQIATLNKGQNIKHLPYAFTEHGVLRAANVLRSPISKSRSGVPPLNPDDKRRGRRFYFNKRELGFHGRERTATYRVKRRRS